MTDASRGASAPEQSTSAAFSGADWVIFSAIAAIWGASFLFIAIGLEAFEPGIITLPSLGEGASEVTGVVLVLLASACYGLAVHLAVPLQLTYGSRPVVTRMLALATIWTLPYGLASLPGSDLELASLAAVTVLGVVGTGLAYLLMGTLVGRVGPTRASFITYLIPVVALVLGVAFRNDQVEAIAVMGVVFVVTGAVLAGREERGSV